ncbi:glycosyltransferase [Catenovulum sp. 2E275]|uniref:glycosyltransferase n=1 Tax=Catenovulum sp. 2E275 TaxID=2980497 RepID=UPI0021D1B166|nr:glycosyltransferase [Catenovulum sp. 2E275]MCU4675546.1 glycosyltransferase [Catenovulum sp. 2E275]
MNHNSTDFFISFIIPAYNEESCIENTLLGIQKYSQKLNHEVILVDNGSTDSTQKIANEYCDQVIYFPEGDTISSVRNKGVEYSKGDILIFLDSDILLTEEWEENIFKTCHVLKSDPLILTGSKYTPPNQYAWLNRFWFNIENKAPANYINSGHLIISRSLFDRINGFDENLKTAEDYDFCQRAIASGAKLQPNAQLRVIHDGYPETAGEFIQRERWHGREDFENMDKFLASKVAWIASFHLLVFTFFVFNALFFTGGVPSFISYACIMFPICMLMVYMKFGFISIRHIANASVIFYLYLVGRSLALVDKILGRYTNNFRK